MQNVVAASGTALTDIHASILARYAKTAYLVFDGDSAGRNATVRSLQIVLPKGIVPRVFALARPDGTKIDPDNFVNEQGADAFREQLQHAEDWLSYLASTTDLQSIEKRAKFITYVKSLVKSIQDRELQNQYLKLIAERFDTTRSLEGIQEIRPQRAKTPAPQQQPDPEFAEYGDAPQQSAEPERVPWEILSPLEIRFANLLVSNPTLMDRACEYFDVELAASGIQFFESGLIEEFVNTIIASYSETGYFSPQTLYEQLPPLLQQFMENLPEESWTPPKEIIELYESLMVLTFRLCDRFRKTISLDTPEGVQKRISLNTFIQNMEKLDRQYKEGKLSIDMLADQLIKSKTPLINTLSVTKG